MKLLKVWKLMSVDSVSFNVNGNYTGAEQWNMAHEYADVIVRDFLRYKEILWHNASHNGIIQETYVEALRILA